MRPQRTGSIRCSYDVPGHITYGFVGSGFGSRGYPSSILAPDPTIMTCAPVLIQLLPGSSFIEYGSVLLAPPSPRSIYMNPTLFGWGSLCAIQAAAQSMAFLSPHIGSGSARSVWPGMHVHCPLPCRNVRVLPSLPTMTIVASFVTASGAADIASFIKSSSLMLALL